MIKTKRNLVNFAIIFFFFVILIVPFAVFSPVCSSAKVGDQPISATSGGWNDAVFEIRDLGVIPSSTYYSIEAPVNVSGTLIDSRILEYEHNATYSEPYCYVALNDTICWQTNGTLVDTNYANYTPPAAPTILIGFGVFNYSSFAYFDIEENGLMGINITDWIAEPNQTLYISYLYAFNVTITYITMGRWSVYPASFTKVTSGEKTYLEATGVSSDHFLSFWVNLPNFGHRITVAFRPPEYQGLNFKLIIKSWNGQGQWGSSATLHYGVAINGFASLQTLYLRNFILAFYYNIPYTLRLLSIDGVDMWYDQIKNPSNTFTRQYLINLTMSVSTFYDTFLDIRAEINAKSIVQFTHNSTFDVRAAIYTSGDYFEWWIYKGQNHLINIKFEFNCGSMLTIKALDSDGNLIEGEVTADIYYAGTNVLFDSITFTDGEHTIRVPPDEYDIFLTTPDGTDYQKSNVGILPQVSSTEIFATNYAPFSVDWVLVGVIVGIAVAVLGIGVVVWWVYFRPQAKVEKTPAWKVRKILRKRGE
jgi:hypothetical protein